MKWRARSIMTDEPYDPKRYRYAYAKAASEIEKNGEFYSPRGTFISTKEAIQIINVCGGKAVWAHPPLSLPQPSMQEKAIPLLTEYGLRGVEVFRSYGSIHEVEFLEWLCEKHNIDPNFGGSDYHGDGPDQQNPAVCLGTCAITFQTSPLFLEKP